MKSAIVITVILLAIIAALWVDDCGGGGIDTFAQIDAASRCQP